VNHTPRLLTTLLIGAAVLLPIPHALAQTGRVDIDIFDRTSGRVLTQHWHNGESYVIGQPGHEYEIRVRNATWGRVLAVTSVDGVNVLSGRTASPSQGGYVIDGYGSVDISGWRKSTDHTAAFYFTSLGDSYAARTGRPNNVGVIGVAIYRERREPRSEPQPWWPREKSLQDAPAAPRSPAPGAATESERAQPRRAEQGYQSHADAERAGSPLGTGHGRIEDSRVRYTEFVRASSRPDHVVTIRYDSLPNLVAQGIVTPRHYAQPNPFPRSPWANGFVPDPR
jgi:hypothetical protein